MYKRQEIIRALEDDKDVKRRVNNFITEKVVVLLAGKGKETAFRLWAVSYTHLDVYKRQLYTGEPIF